MCFQTFVVLKIPAVLVQELAAFHLFVNQRSGVIDGAILTAIGLPGQAEGSRHRRVEPVFKPADQDTPLRFLCNELLTAFDLLLREDWLGRKMADFLSEQKKRLDMSDVHTTRTAHHYGIVQLFVPERGRCGRWPRQVIVIEGQVLGQLIPCTWSCIQPRTFFSWYHSATAA